MLVDEELLIELQNKSMSSERRRTNYNFHKQASDPMQRMLNVLQPDSYVRPHKHESPDKREAFIIIEGRLLIVLFDNFGKVTQSAVLDREQGVYVLEIEPAKYHTIIALDENTVVYEIKDGPYNPEDDKDFAPWAPSESEQEAAQSYMFKLKQLIR